MNPQEGVTMLSQIQNHDVQVIDRGVVVAIDRHVVGSHRVRPNMRLGKRLQMQWYSAKEQTATTPACSDLAASARAPLPAAAWASLVLGAALST